ncbi:MAG: PASTA domain-containing protein [Acidobacteriota bacterium]
MKLKRVSVFAAKIGAIGATSLLLLVLSFYVSMRLVITGNDVTVPDLVGHTLEDSTRVAGGASLMVEETQQRFDPRVPAGEVISQMPPPGAAIKKRRKVRVVVSLGTEILSVPDLTGETERHAAIEIDRLGLQLGHVSRATTTHPVDRVVAQDPMPGTEIFRGEAVSLLVSRGRQDPTYVMPDLSGHAVREVEQAFSRVGFALSRTSYKDDWTPAGTVLRQFPPAGYPVDRRDPITVVVSRGPSV